MSQRANAGTEEGAEPKAAEDAGSDDQRELTDSQLQSVAGGFLGGLIKKAGGSVGKPVKSPIKLVE